MGYVEIRKLTPHDRLDTCDKCGQQGIYENGQVIKNSYNETVLWLCFNCKDKAVSKEG